MQIIKNFLGSYFFSNMFCDDKSQFKPVVRRNFGNCDKFNYFGQKLTFYS
jgi:hypothetical protein